MSRRLRRAVFLTLLALGALGLLATGSGVWSGSPWPWLVVLGLGVAAQVAGDHYDQRQRLARRTEKRLRDMADRIENVSHIMTNNLDVLRGRFEAHASVITPDGMKHLHGLVERMSKDLAPIVEEWGAVKTAGGLRALVSRR